MSLMMQGIYIHNSRRGQSLRMVFSTFARNLGCFLTANGSNGEKLFMELTVKKSLITLIIYIHIPLILCLACERYYTVKGLLFNELYS